MSDFEAKKTAKQGEIEALEAKLNERLAEFGFSDRSELDPPEYLDETAANHWKKLVLTVVAVGFGGSAFDALALYCAAWSRWKTAQEVLSTEGLTVTTPNGYPVQHPALAISNKAAEQMLKFGKVLGLPYERPRNQ